MTLGLMQSHQPRGASAAPGRLDSVHDFLDFQVKPREPEGLSDFPRTAQQGGTGAPSSAGWSLCFPSHKTHTSPGTGLVCRCTVTTRWTAKLRPPQVSVPSVPSPVPVAHLLWLVGPEWAGGVLTLVGKGKQYIPGWD